MFASSTKICLFFISIFLLFQLNNSKCVDIDNPCRGNGKGNCCVGSCVKGKCYCAAYGLKCTGKGQGNCCAGSCNNGICCINQGHACGDSSHNKKCCPGTSCDGFICV
ncbi:unnamed protein product [Meloidogyne enterolobii]|uniref:Uncharacterized protein n=1 Tax=Meloidogyne enterolobii TaxID=390850 RepID=A0ACB0ZJR8_MELEN